jgi:hypothetical protein
MSDFRALVAVAVIAQLVPLSSTAAAQTTNASSKLRIVVIAGEDAVNVIQQKTAVAPLVEVRDENNQPVAGAIVRFTVRGGNATIGGANTASVTTNAVGQAAAGQLTPTAAGAVRIDVLATAQGQTASATISQTNYATAAQAASGAKPSQGGNAGKIVGLSTAAAAAGAAYAFKDKLLGDEPIQPAIEGLQPNPASGLVNLTPIDILMSNSTWEYGRTTFAINWGDGETWSGPSLDNGDYPLHTYRTPGEFTIQLTITDKSGLSASSTTSVSIRSMTGRWVATGATLDLVQNGTDLSGVYTATSGSGGVTGRMSQPPNTVQAQIVFSVGSATFTGVADVNLFFGSFNNGPNLTFRRQ